MRTKEQIQKYQKEYRIKNKEYLKNYNKEYGKKWFQDNKERLKPIRDKWEKENPMKRYFITHRYLDNNREKVNEMSRIFRKNNPFVVKSRLEKFRKTLKGKFNTLKGNARRRNLDIGITFSRYESLMNGNCFYCGTKDSIGIDRIDNSLGYIDGNVASCCKICNFMKKVHSKEFFIDHISKIYKHLTKQ